MNISAMSSALTGLTAAQASFDSAAGGVADGSSDLVTGITQTDQASTQVDIGIDVLRMAMQNQHALVDILA
jgi:hypothetical protein